ncbi:MAG: hypothetical protein NVS4B8_23740 [Herpetosiphon sp.]
MNKLYIFGAVVTCIVFTACGNTIASPNDSQRPGMTSTSLTARGSGTTYPGGVPTTVPRMTTSPEGTGGRSTALIQQLKDLVAGPIATLTTAGVAGNKDDARKALASLETSWGQIEASVKAQSPQSYQDIEKAVTALTDVAIRDATPDPAAVQRAGTSLSTAVNQFIEQVNK